MPAMLEYPALIVVHQGMDPHGQTPQSGADDNHGWFGHGFLLF
jgi:hypothetical protein